MAVEYETLVQGGHSKLVEEIFKKVKDKTLVDEVKGTDSFPYHFRQTPYGDRLKEKIVGATVAWNQLAKAINSPNYVAEPNVSATFNNETIVFTSQQVNNGVATSLLQLVKPNTVYLISYEGMSESPVTINTLLGGTSGRGKTQALTTSLTHYTGIVKTASNSSGAFYIYPIDSSGLGVQITIKKLNVHNLTAMFGTEIADRFHNLEQTTAGSGVALFRKLFPKEYYASNGIELLSVSGLVSHDEVGFNVWDEEWENGWVNTSTGENQNASDALRSKNYIEVLPNTSYYISTKHTANNQVPYTLWYDSEKKYIGEVHAGSGQHELTVTSATNARFMRFAVANLPTPVTYNHDICINLSDPSRNGTYEPYIKHSYPLDDSLTLRGVPKLVDNKIKFDGDVYESDGKVTRRYGVVDLGTLDWDIRSIPDTHIFRAQLNDAKSSSAIQSRQNDPVNAIISCCYICKGYTPLSGNDDKCFAIGYSPSGVTDTRFVIVDHAYSDIDTFKTAMSGVMLVYELATPTIEEAQPFQSPQRCFEGGTEEYVTTGIVPVGHESEYVSNKAERFDVLPDVTSKDGYYIIRQENGVMKLVDADESSDLVETEEGNPVTFEAKSAQMAKSTKITFEPIQDLHGYDHPWPAGGGKNLFDKSAVTNGYYIESNGTITETSWWCVSDYMPVTEGNYIASGYAINGSGVYLAVYNANKEYIRSVGMIISEPTTTVVTISTGEAYVRMSVRTLASEQNTAQFEKGSTATTFEPYSNICPISGADEVDVVVSTGKNLFGGEANALFRLFIPSGTRVTASDLGGGNIRYYDAYQNEIDYWTLINTESVSGRKYRSFTVSSDTYFVKFDVGSTTASDFQLEVGSAPTSYEPYQGSEVSTDLPEPVYSGTLDLETGVVVADMAMVKVSDLTWERLASQFNQSTSLENVIKRVATNSEKSSAIMSCYMTIPWNDNDDMSFSVSIQGRISVTDSRYSSVSEWFHYMKNEQICYELATPITYQLTPQQLALFKGTNVVQTNAKSVKVTYRNGKLALMDDIPQQLAIEEAKTDEKISTSISPILGDFATVEISPSSANHAVGEYLLYNNRLYKVLAAISAGQQLTIGTNVGQTNVAAELASLNRRSAMYGLTTNVGLDIQLESGKRYLLITSRGANSESGSAIYIIAASASGSSIINAFAHDQKVTVTLKSSLVITVTSTEDYVNVWLLES